MNDIINKHYKDIVCSFEREFEKALLHKGIYLTGDKLYSFISENCDVLNGHYEDIYRLKKVPIMKVIRKYDFDNNKAETIIEHI
jgi:hypothetical protein